MVIPEPQGAPPSRPENFNTRPTSTRKGAGR